MAAGFAFEMRRRFGEPAEAEAEAEACYSPYPAFE
jgi:hypothetical protein